MKRLILLFFVTAVLFAGRQFSAAAQESTIATAGGPGESRQELVLLASYGQETPSAAAKADQSEPALLCPACKVIIDYSSLVAAGEDISKSAYGAWEAVLKGYESGAFTWAEIEADVNLACKWAEEMRAWTASMEKRIRELSLRPAPPPKKP